MKTADVEALIDDFDKRRQDSTDLATDQLLNAVFLTIAMRDVTQRSFSEDELKALRADLMRQLSGPDA